MKNYLLVNRALAAEKNINYFNNLFSRVKEHSSPTVNRRSTDGQSQRQYTIGIWKYVAMIFAVLVMSVANVGTAWGKYLYLSTANHTSWENDEAIFKLYPGTGSDIAGTKIYDHMYRFDVTAVSTSSNAMYFKRYKKDGSTKWNEFSVTYNATYNTYKVTGWDAGSCANSNLTEIYLDVHNEWYKDSPIFKLTTGGTTYVTTGFAGTNLVIFSIPSPSGTLQFERWSSDNKTKWNQLSTTYNSSYNAYEVASDIGSVYASYNVKIVDKPNYIYFDNSQIAFGTSNAYVVVGHDKPTAYSSTYAFGTKPIPNTKLYYYNNTGNTWRDATYYAFLQNSSSFGGGSWGSSNLSAASKYTAAYTTATDLSWDKMYLFVPASGSNGASLTLNTYSAASDMNSTQTIKYAISIDNGSSYTELTSGKTLAQLQISAYKFTDAYNSVSNSSNSQTLSANSTTYSASVPAGYTGKTTLSYGSVQTGYTFVDWADGPNGSTITSPYYPTGEKTVYARFKATQVTVTLNKNSGTGGTASVKATYGVGTLPSITNPTRSDYEFAGWFTGSGGTGKLVIDIDGSLQPGISGFTDADGKWIATSNKNVYAGWLTVHSPGAYTDTYGQALTIANSAQYEVYRYAVNSSTIYVNAGGESAPITTSDPRNLFSFSQSGTSGACDYTWSEWIGHTQTYGKDTETATASGEFKAHSVCQPKCRNQQGFIICVTGYSEFSIYAKDNATSGGENFKVFINGANQSMTLSKSWTVRRFALTPANTYVIRVTGQTDSNNQIQGFSLKVPCPAYTLDRGGQENGTYTVGSYDGNALTCTPSASGTYTYQWKQYTSGQGVGDTINAVGSGANTNSFTPNPASAGTYYYMCRVLNVCGDKQVTSTTGTFVFSAAPSCSAPDAPTISGTADYIVGQTLTLTASCESGADASTTYTWYKGDTWGSKSQVQAAAVAGSNGNKYTKTAAVGDAGTYWCEASNGSGCEAHNSTGEAVTVVYKVTYNNNGGSGTISNSTGTSITLSNGTGFTAPDGYTFDGWNTAADGSGTGYTSGQTGVTANLDLYARWKQTVTIDDQGGSKDGSVVVYYNGTAGTPTAPTYAGHTPDLGYYAESGCATKVMNLNGSLVSNVTDGSSVAWTNSSGKWIKTGSSKLYAHWKCDAPTITDNGDNTVSISVPSGTTVRYTTDGTDPSSSVGTEYSSAFDVVSNCTVKAVAYQTGCTDSEVASRSITLCTPVFGSVTFDNNKSEKYDNSYNTSTDVEIVGTASWTQSGVSSDADHEMTKPAMKLDSGDDYIKITLPSGITSGTITVLACTYNGSSGTLIINDGNNSTTPLASAEVGQKNSSAYYMVNSPDGKSWTDPTLQTLTYSSISAGGDFYIKKSAGANIYVYAFSATSESACAKPTVTATRLTAEYMPTGSSGVQIGVTVTGASTGWKYRVKNKNGGYETPDNNTYSTSTWTMTSTIGTGANTYKVELYDNSATPVKMAVSDVITVHGEVAYPMTIAAGEGGTVSPTSASANGNHLNPTITATPNSGYHFVNWTLSNANATLDDATSATTTISSASGACTITANFAVDVVGYTVTYNGNGATSGDAPVDASSPYDAGSNVTVLGNTGELAKTNYTFDGWATANDGTGTSYEAAGTISSIAANTTLYAKWKQTVTLKTGAQGSGADQTPYVYINGTGVNSFTAHTATGYTLQGYYTTGSGGVKVLNADGTFAAANVTDYITSSKWSRTGAAPTLYAQWVAAEDCSTSDFVIKKGDDKEYQGCMESSSYNGTATSFTAGSPTTVGKAKMTISNYSDGIKRPGSGNTFSIVIEPVSGYYLKSVCWAGKVENDETVSYYWDDNSGSATTITPQTTSGTGVTYNAPSNTTKFTASYVDDGDKSGGIYWRNVQVEVCAAGGTTYSVTYNGNDETSGSVPTGATNYNYSGTVTVLGNTGDLAKTNYTFAGWTTNNDGTGSSYVADNTFSITANTTLYAKWTQSVTLNKNGGSTDGSATAVWNATGLTGITHAKPAAGYKLLGYYSTPSAGTKVLNSDGSFAATNVTGYITDGKWSRTSATTLYAEYESAGALIWNLSVNTDATSLTTSSKTSAFTEISTSNMSNAELKGGLSYSKSKKSELTGKIDVPSSEDAAKYVELTFKVADGYKFTPSSAKVIIQPVETSNSDAKIILTDGTRTITKTKENLAKGKKDTVTLTNSDDTKYMMGTVTLKIYVYGASSETYRLGTPIIIEGEVEEACATMPSFTRLSFGETSYKVDDTPNDLEVVGGTNITTYAWKQNTVNDRSGGDDADGDNDGSSYTPSTSSAGTMYYWCEMTNSTCGITIKTSAVGITVNEVKTDATVTWDSKAKYSDSDTTAYYGGKNYTLKATLNSGWDGTLTSEMFTAPTGIRLHDFTIDNSSNPKTITATFDVLTTFDVDGNDSIAFTLSLPATTGYNALSSEKKVAYNECSGGGEGSSYNICMRKTVTKDGNYYHCANTDGWISPNISSSYSTGKAGTTMATYFDTVASSNTQYVWVRTYHANINKVRIYADFRANDMTVSNVYKHTDYFTANSKYAVDYTAVYNGDEENENTGTAAQGYVDITLDEVMAANDILLVKFNDNKVRPLGAVITESSAGSKTTSLAWSNSLADKATVAKTQSSANFTYTASPTGTNSNTLGAVTYSSSNTSCATVNATTGEVTITATGTSDLSTTITATLAASGCYKGKTITYTIDVPGVSCTVTTGTLTSDVTSKCSKKEATLTLRGFESGASVQWYKGESTISDDATYDISDDGTTLVTEEAGTYSVMVTNSAGTCSDRSNSITISNISATASVTKIVDEWYVKNGRPTPDIALWSVSEGAKLKSVAWSPTNATGLDCELRDGIIYLEGKEPNTNSSSDVEYTLTATITDECGDDHEETTKTIKITHQKNTDKHVLAFVVNGTDKGGFTEGITAAQTTDVPLYKTIAANFDVQATNCYASDDEKKVKQYYSQFDILCITDYPNTGTKGVNKKSYVDALGALVDIRPILTMEAFVAKLANWKAKGISGTPQSPTTRQYTMLLQCKDHEIFSGTKLTKVGEGDETMYRVSMVDNTQEEYVSLDATYGDGAHADKSGYEYASKPALQGFTFTKEMLDDDLLPLGLIDDGSGNDLQVGIERQTEMEARLMVLGINSYAMERLTDDGQTVVVNALKYLMKKNSEDIADCSNTFVGGDDEEDESTRYNWNVASHWSGNAVPDRTQKVRIVAPCVIPANVKPHVAGVIIAPSGKYNHGANTASGSLTIAAGGALIVDGKVEAATAPLYTEIRATSPSDLILQTNSTAQSALIFDNDKGETQATVNFYSLGRNEGAFQYQYIASPMEVVPVSESYAGTGVYTYVYTEAGGWERRGYYTDLYAFEGVAITTRSATATEYTVSGTLAHTNEREIDITVEHGGDNMIGNSWTAPIQISELSKAPNTATLESSTVYVYCSGRDATLGTGASGTTETAGQWLAIPFEAASFDGWSGLKVIPAMNAFEFLATTAGTITLNYDTLVRGGSQYDLTAKARAPKRIVAHEGIDLVRIRVADTKTHIDIHLFEGDVFSEAFDDGWEAKYIDGEGVSAQLYAMNGEDKMAVLATSTLEGTVLGFVPGREREYTFSFHGADNGYYLNDLKLKTSTPISETEHYTFTYEEGDTHRFYISKTRIDAPQTPTEVTNPEVETPKAQKFIYKDKMYIMINGRVYSAEGALVK